MKRRAFRLRLLIDRSKNKKTSISSEDNVLVKKVEERIQKKTTKKNGINRDYMTYFQEKLQRCEVCKEWFNEDDKTIEVADGYIWHLSCYQRVLKTMKEHPDILKKQFGTSKLDVTHAHKYFDMFRDINIFEWIQKGMKLRSKD